jgi:hypothetical protein
MKEEVFRNEYARSVVCSGANDLLHCTVCNLDLQTYEQAEAHVRGKKHGNPHYFFIIIKVCQRPFFRQPFEYDSIFILETIIS